MILQSAIVGGVRQQILDTSTRNTVAPVITGDGADGTTMTSTDGTWVYTAGGYTYQWQSDGVDISGATASTYTVTGVTEDTDLTLDVTNNSVTATSNTVNSAPVVLWTPAEISTELWLKAEAANITVSGTEVTQWTDLSGNNRHMLQSEPAQRATFINEAGGIVCNIATDLGVVDTMTFDGFLAVMQVGDGTDTTFTKYCRLMESLNGWKIRGHQAQNYWDASSSTPDSYVNGSATTTNIACPMPKSIQRFAFASRTADVFMLHGNTGNQGWHGPVWEIVVPASGTSAANITKLEGYLAWENGIQGSLDAGHTHKSAAPTI